MPAEAGSLLGKQRSTRLKLCVLWALPGAGKVGHRGVVQSAVRDVGESRARWQSRRGAPGAPERVPEPLGFLRLIEAIARFEVKRTGLTYTAQFISICRWLKLIC